VLEAHTCNPSYSGSSDQEDSGSKPAQGANSSQDSISKNPTHERTGGVAEVVRASLASPEFKPQCCKKKKKNPWIFLQSQCRRISWHSTKLRIHKEEIHFL
jgi:hypothetical protein